MDFLLKQRLVGAIVLVALGVIFIPILLEGPNQELVPAMEPLPTLTEQPVSVELSRFPVAAEVPVEAEVAVLQADTSQTAPAAEITVSTEPVPIPASPSAQPAVKVKSEPATVVGVLGNWVVQMGSFSSEQNALRLRDRLRKAGFVTQVEKVRVQQKLHFRVRVGPYLERAEADRDQTKLAKQLNLNGRVLTYP